MPPGRNGSIYSIGKRRGRPDCVRVKDACTAHDFYVIEDDAGNKDAVLEDMLQKVESYAARRIDRLVTRPGVTPPEDERMTLALYLVLTYMRTPRMRDQIRWTADTWTVAHFRSMLEADPPWQRARRAVFAHMSDEEAEEMRVTLLKDIDAGNLGVEFPEPYYLIQTMRFVVDQAFVAAGLEWTVMRAPAGSEYVIGDHAATMYDPIVNASRGRKGNGLVSSPVAEMVLPFDRSVAVRLSYNDEEGRWNDVEVEPAVVDELNLRTYAWAESEIYGSSQALVVDVRERARANPRAAAEFEPNLGPLLIENDYPTVEGSHRRDVQVFRPPSRRYASRSQT
jgi:hypothetical protein